MGGYRARRGDAMRKALFIALFACLSAQAWGTAYFLSPSGSDSNNGLSSGAPWLSPNHALNCGDTISAATGTYSSANFQSGKWGTVTCSASNNVAWLICATFDGCKVTATTQDAMRFDKSYWGLVGWEASTNTTQSGGCITITSDSSGVNAHHIIIADNVANGCQGGGITSYNLNGSTGVDYLVIIGNIIYNAAVGNTHCFSGISIYQPVASDSNTGTHLYVAGNFSYDNVDSPPGSTTPGVCSGGPSTDGEPVIIDTLDGAQSGPQYNQQIVVQNNLGMFNGGRGFEIFNNILQTTPALVYIKYNTAYGNMTDNNQTNGCLGRSEIALGHAASTTMDFNLAQTKTGTSCSSGALYGSFIETGNTTDTVPHGWYYSAAGHPTGIDNSGSFAFGAITSTNPAFSNPVDPGAPSCGSFGSTVACMATVISNFAPTTSGASAYGRQTVSNTSITDALFPQWLCTSTGVLNANIPAGLVTPGCGVSGVTTSSGLACVGGGSPSGGLPGPGGSPPTQGQPCG